VSHVAGFAEADNGLPRQGGDQLKMYKTAQAEEQLCFPWTLAFAGIG
jgi:hypothetical protein